MSSIDKVSGDWPNFDGYNPIPAGKREIRLLKFKRLDNQRNAPDYANYSDLKLSLEHVALDGSHIPQYYALSYNWGADTRMTSINVNGQPVRVRYTLEHFLQCFCQAWGGWVANLFTLGQRMEIRFWLDALCINQKDDNEKNEQLKMMGDIYKSAHGVVAWLGEPTSRSNDFLGLVCTGPYQSKWPSWWSLPSMHQRIVREGLKDILSRPYWSRLWILQEIALAQKVELLCGRRTCYWGKLKDPIEYLRLDNGLSGSDMWITMKESNLVWEELRRHDNWKPGESPLVRIVLKFYQAECSDPRDKLYGLLSMARASDRSDIPIDYTAHKTAWDVLLDFWMHYVKRYPDNKEVQERRVIGLVWVLWFQMEIQGLPNRYDIVARDAEMLKQVLGGQGFRVKARPLARYREFEVTDHVQQQLGLCDRESFFDFHSTAGECTSRRWLIVSERLEPADICYVVEDQPSSISWKGDLETVPNQTMIIFRVNSYEFRCVGRGKELIPGSTLDVLAVGSNFNLSARYQLHPRHEPQWIRQLLNDFGDTTVDLELNAVAVCEVMHSSLDIPWYLGWDGRKRVHFKNRTGDVSGSIFL